MIYRTYKHNKKYICYIEKSLNGDFIVKTGKPSDITCLSWHYKTEFEAIATATEFFTNFLKSTNYLRA